MSSTAKDQVVVRKYLQISRNITGIPKVKIETEKDVKDIEPKRFISSNGKSFTQAKKVGNKN